MTTLDKPADNAPNPTLGILLKVVSVFVFVAMQTAIKAGGEGIPAGEIVFFRSFFALLPVAAYLAWEGSLSTALRTRHVGGHVMRGVVGVVSMGLSFFALTRMPYAEWIAISYAAPLLTVVFAAFFLKEVVRAYRWTAVIVGLIGIIIVSFPRFSLSGRAMDAEEIAGITAALAAAAVAAIAMVQIRRLVRHETTPTIVIYFSLTCSAVALLTAPFGWVVPSLGQTALLVFSGLCGGVGQLLLTACYRNADTSTIAPFEYTSLLLAIAIGYFLFGEEATVSTLVGAAVVVAAGVFIIFREHQLGIERAKARRVTPPQG